METRGNSAGTADDLCDQRITQAGSTGDMMLSFEAMSNSHSNKYNCEMHMLCYHFIQAKPLSDVRVMSK